MKLIKPLIFPKCFEDESPAGYLIRLAQLNHYGSYRWLVTERRGPSISLVELYELLCQSPWTGFHKLHSFNDLNGLSYRYLQTPKIKVCTACLDESRYLSYKAHAVLSPICVKHECWKTDTCPGCKRSYSWHLGTLQVCSCKTQRIGIAEKPTKQAIELAAFIDAERQENVATKLESEEFSYKSRCDLFLLFALHLGGANRAGDFPRFNAVQDIKECWEKIADLLFGEPRKFYDFLRSLHGKNPDLFKHFYRGFQDFDQLSLAEHRDVLINYITRDLKTPISKQHRSLYRDKPSANIWLPLQTVSRQYDIPKSTLKQLIEKDKIKHQFKVFERRSQTLIYIDTPGQFQAFINQYVTYKRAYELLGVTKAQLKLIIESGYLSDVCKPEKNYLKWLISSTGISELKVRLHSNLQQRGCDGVTVSEALSYYSEGFDNLIKDLINAVLTGQITVIATSPEKFVRDIRLDKEEFVAWRSQKIKVSGKMSIVDLAGRFGINQESMYQIVNAGLIQAEDCGKNRLNRLISEHEIDKFKQQYALLSKIAAAKNTSSSTLQSIIQPYRIHPVKTATGEKLRQTIYRRVELKKCTHLTYIVEKKGDWWFDRNYPLTA